MTIYERELLLVKDLRKLLKDIDYQMDESQKALDITMSEKMDLQTRIDKAIEYIDNSTINPEDLTLYDNMTKEEYLMLKKILKGEE